MPTVRERRGRIEHFLFRKLDLIRRAAQMSVPVCVQPTFIDFRIDDFRQRDETPLVEYLATTNALRDLLEE